MLSLVEMLSEMLTLVLSLIDTDSLRLTEVERLSRVLMLSDTDSDVEMLSLTDADSDALTEVLSEMLNEAD